jgi:UDP-galactopyranose mutase
VFNFEHNGCDTIVTEEYPRQATKNDIPFYPIPFGDSNYIYKKYEELVKNENGVIFIGRLAQYKYLDMWMAVKHAMLKLKNI